MVQNNHPRKGIAGSEIKKRDILLGPAPIEKKTKGVGVEGMRRGGEKVAEKRNRVKTNSKGREMGVVSSCEL